MLAYQKFQHCAVLACAELNFSNKKLEYLRENEFLRKTILTCLLGAQVGWSNEIKNAKKNLVTLYTSAKFKIISLYAR